MAVPDFTVGASSGGTACSAHVLSTVATALSAGATTTLDVADGSIFAATDFILLVEDDIPDGAVGARHVVQVTSVSINALTIPSTSVVNAVSLGVRVTKLCVLTVNNGPDLQDTDSIKSNDGSVFGTVVGSNTQLTPTTYLVKRGRGTFATALASTFMATVNNAASAFVCGTCSVGDASVNAATCSSGGTCTATATQQPIQGSLGPHVAKDVCSGYECESRNRFVPPSSLNLPQSPLCVFLPNTAPNLPLLI
jgi:hypothetical protein